MPFTFENDQFKVTETSSDFQIESKRTGKIVGMGDMVGAYFDENGSIYVGTDEFYRALENDLKTYANEYMESYFPEEVFQKQK